MAIILEEISFFAKILAGERDITTPQIKIIRKRIMENGSFDGSKFLIPCESLHKTEQLESKPKTHG